MTTMTQDATISVGERFSQAYREDPEKAEVHFDFTITDAFGPGKDRPRLTARHLFKKEPVTRETVHGWFETRAGGQEAAEPGPGLREESFRFGVAAHTAGPITGWVRLPEELADHPQSLAQFIDHRLMVRLGTAENRALTLDVLEHPDVAALPYTGSYRAGLLAAFNEIEQTGGTAHAMMVNPVDYYRELVGAGSLLADLAREKVLICRHRHVAPGCAIVGDFAMGARLLDARTSVVRVAEPPPGTLAQRGPAVCAEVYERVAVRQPTHFFHVTPAGRLS